jgi:GNAT superfamily N-acetyltransferase
VPSRAFLWRGTIDVGANAFLRSGECIVGFYALVRQSRTEYELDALFVEPAFIGKGFGRLLVEHAKSVASTMGGTKLIIQGDPNAERFYLAMGGVLTGRKESGSIPGRFLPTFSVDLTGNHAA